MFITPFQTMPALEDMDDTPPPPAPVEDEMPPAPEDPDVVPYVDETPAPLPSEDDLITVDDMMPDDENIMDDLGEEVTASESLLMEIEHLSNLAVAIETHGISPGMMLVADREGLLASTFIGKIPATESMAGPYRPDSATSQAALEGVMDAIKSKSAEWAAKIGATLTSVASKAGGMIKHAAEATSSMAKTIAGKTWDATKATGKTIKAHPYKTVAAVLAAIAAVGAALALIWAFPTQASQVAGWYKRVQSAVTSIKMPGGKVMVELPKLAGPESSSRALVQWVPTPDSAAEATDKISALGWTKNALTSAATSLGAGLMKVASLIFKAVKAVHAPALAASGTAGRVSEAATHAGLKAVGVGEFAAKGVAGVVGFVAWKQMLMFSLALTYKLIGKVVMSGYRLVKSTVTKVVSAVSGKAEAEPAMA